jgi:uncharacterized protein
MSDETPPPAGGIGWMDLTVEDAAGVRDFYRGVAGWEVAEEVEMGGYADFVMRDRGGAVVGGICHARGANAGIPPVWLPYLTVPSVEEAVAACLRLGGTVVAPPRAAGGGTFAVVRDPAGATVALYQA